MAPPATSTSARPKRWNRISPTLPSASSWRWTDEFRGKFGVRANADIPRDAKVARAFGAEGIGLCRTEHMFFAEDRLPFVQQMILARDEKNRKKALAKLLPMQRSDFAGLFKAMDGFPVVIRTLDPPLHEFLPKRENLMVDIAVLPYADTKMKKEISERYSIPVKDLKKVLPELLHRVEELHEFNPMLGHRGCRLGVTYPEITEMQARAIFEAAVQVAKKGIKVIPEVMIPLIGSVEELKNQKDIVVRVAEEVFAKAGTTVDYHGRHHDRNPARRSHRGSSGEGSRVLLLRHQRSHADHDGSLPRRLYEVPEGLRERQNLQGRSVRGARSGRRRQAGRRWPWMLGRKARPDLEVGICGEHGGEPSSVQFCQKVGMDYVSCSPYRVPIARLAAAQGAIMRRYGREGETVATRANRVTCSGKGGARRRFFRAKMAPNQALL